MNAIPKIEPETEQKRWRTIDTAPKDGSRFLSYTEDGGIDFFRWQDFGDDRAPVGWRDSFITVYRARDPRGPKHWMPLPAPPATPVAPQPPIYVTHDDFCFEDMPKPATLIPLDASGAVANLVGDFDGGDFGEGA